MQKERWYGEKAKQIAHVLCRLQKKKREEKPGYDTSYFCRRYMYRRWSTSHINMPVLSWKKIPRDRACFC